MLKLDKGNLTVLMWRDGYIFPMNKLQKTNMKYNCTASKTSQ